MNEEWCKMQPFEHRMTHGMLNFSIGEAMTAGAINPQAMSYGYDRLRFARPVLLNDTIRAQGSVKGIQEVAKHLLLVERREVKTG